MVQDSHDTGASSGRLFRGVSAVITTCVVVELEFMTIVLLRGSGIRDIEQLPLKQSRRDENG